MEVILKMQNKSGMGAQGVVGGRVVGGEPRIGYFENAKKSVVGAQGW